MGTAKKASLLEAPLLEAMRPHQWVKNLLVFAPLVFAERMFQAGPLARATAAFAAFCCIASAVYLLNDLMDLRADQCHPEKKERALASGRLERRAAMIALSALTVIGLLIGATFGFVVPLGFYWAINVAYSFGLRHFVILDAMCISIGFLLRVFAGGQAIDVQISDWLILCTFFIAMLLAFGKRRHELSILGEDSSGHRKTLDDYSLQFLDQMIAPLGALTVMAYAVYTIWPATIEKFGTHELVFTVPFVVFGIFRYLFLVHERGEGGNPARLLLRDRALVINILAWLLVSVWIVYGR
ncbi:MAG: decaprenyl-phosphate phosphoribosyltransferase [Planctomycetota bacterium]